MSQLQREIERLGKNGLETDAGGTAFGAGCGWGIMLSLYVFIYFKKEKH